MNIRINKLSLSLLCATSAMAITVAAHAQTATPAETIETIEVSASRLTTGGFTAPTPTTVLTMQDIQNTAQPTIFDAVNQLPSLQGSVGLSGSPNDGSSTGTNGLSSFSLRALGISRTLTLIDGQRVVPSNINGVNDVAAFPQMLIKRVDVVTGGASASWGSDAVGGVVNFVTDKTYTGFKGHIEGGMSNYNDDYSMLAQFAAGTSFAGGKGHIEAATEFYDNNGVKGIPRTNVSGVNGRCCNYNEGSLSYTLTTTPAGYPTGAVPMANIQSITLSRYGLITGGPLKGTAFDVSGQPVPFVYGSPCVANNCVGGDLSGQGGRGSSTEDGTTRGNFYTRVSYDLLPNLQVYGTLNYGTSLDSNNDRTMPKTGLTIQCGTSTVVGGLNPYLPAGIQQACLTNHVTNFPLSLGGDNIATTFPDVFHIKRTQKRYVLGATGDFNVLGTDWTLDTYAEHGENHSTTRFKNMPLLPHLNAAIDPIAGPNGTVICRSAVARAAGCLPIDIFGGGDISPAARAWVAPETGAFQIADERQEAFSAVFNGSPFKNWAGDVAVAWGVEYREEAYVARGDAYGAGVSAQSPLTANEPGDATLNLTGGTNWRTGNFYDGAGNYHVYEAFTEFGIPLFNTVQFGKADFNLAGRATDYSTSGFVDTWKVGMTWDTPIDGVRLRALQSRDVRAPNLGELFAPPASSAHTFIDRTKNPTDPTAMVNGYDLTGGNPNLKPEKAQTTEIGIIYSPSYISGLNLSVDYFRVAVKGQIGTLTDQQQIDLCQIQGNNNYCSTFSLTGAIGTPVFPYAQLTPFNLASSTLEGFDIEASYQFSLEDWGIPGDFTARALASNMGKYIVNSGVPGSPISEAAGATVNLASNNTTAPVYHWKLNLTQSWTYKNFNIHVAERYFSAGMNNPYAIVCQYPNCPAPTAQNPTTAYNHTPDYLFIDVGTSYKISDAVEVYAQINNIADQMNKFVPGGAVDRIGRIYHAGVRFGL